MTSRRWRQLTASRPAPKAHLLRCIIGIDIGIAGVAAFYRKRAAQSRAKGFVQVSVLDCGDVVTGIGDDGAVLRVEADRDLVVVIDTLVEGVHFPERIRPADLGYRAVAVNLSDIAAMGARPRWMTLALTLATAEAAWLESFADGLFSAASEHGVQLVGGDTTRGEQLVVSVQLTGCVARGCAIHRAGAQVGDTIYVTGTVGDAAAGLELSTRGKTDDDLLERYLRPTARVDYGQSLVGVASAAIDVSDGLYGDLRKLLQASEVGADIDLDRLPVSAALRANFDRSAQQRFALSGGDDYELCFTAADGTLGGTDGLRVTAIGTVTRGGRITLRDDGVVVPFEDEGYRHFQ